MNRRRRDSRSYCASSGVDSPLIPVRSQRACAAMPPSSSPLLNANRISLWFRKSCEDALLRSIVSLDRVRVRTEAGPWRSGRGGWVEPGGPGALPFIVNWRPAPGSKFIPREGPSRRPRSAILPPRRPIYSFLVQHIHTRSPIHVGARACTSTQQSDFFSQLRLFLNACPPCAQTAPSPPNVSSALPSSASPPWRSALAPPTARALTPSLALPR